MDAFHTITVLAMSTSVLSVSGLFCYFHYWVVPLLGGGGLSVKSQGIPPCGWAFLCFMGQCHSLLHRLCFSFPKTVKVTGCDSHHPKAVLFVLSVIVTRALAVMGLGFSFSQ